MESPRHSSSQRHKRTRAKRSSSESLATSTAENQTTHQSAFPPPYSVASSASFQPKFYNSRDFPTAYNQIHVLSSTPTTSQNGVATLIHDDQSAQSFPASRHQVSMNSYISRNYPFMLYAPSIPTISTPNAHSDKPLPCALSSTATTASAATPISATSSAHPSYFNYSPTETSTCYTVGSRQANDSYQGRIDYHYTTAPNYVSIDNCHTHSGFFNNPSYACSTRIHPQSNSNNSCPINVDTHSFFSPEAYPGEVYASHTPHSTVSPFPPTLRSQSIPTSPVDHSNRSQRNDFQGHSTFNYADNYIYEGATRNQSTLQLPLRCFSGLQPSVTPSSYQSYFTHNTEYHSPSAAQHTHTSGDVQMPTFLTTQSSSRLVSESPPPLFHHTQSISNRNDHLSSCIANVPSNNFTTPCHSHCPSSFSCQSSRGASPALSRINSPCRKSSGKTKMEIENDDKRILNSEKVNSRKSRRNLKAKEIDSQGHESGTRLCVGISPRMARGDKVKSESRESEEELKSRYAPRRVSQTVSDSYAFESSVRQFSETNIEDRNSVPNLQNSLCDGRRYRWTQKSSCTKASSDVAVARNSSQIELSLPVRKASFGVEKAASLSYSVSRGLRNRVGENNCFLNVVLQSLWNLSSFRHSFLYSPEHVHKRRRSRQKNCDSHNNRKLVDNAICNSALEVQGDEMPRGNNSPYRIHDSHPTNQIHQHRTRNSNFPNEEFYHQRSDNNTPDDANTHSHNDDGDDDELGDTACVFCALKTLFANYAYSTSSVLPPDSVRLALSKSFEKSKKFKLGSMEDADETFEALLSDLHCRHIASSEANGGDAVVEESNWLDDVVCNPPCISHEVFSVELIDLTRCVECGETSEPIVTSSYVYRLLTSEILSHMNDCQNKSSTLLSDKKSKNGNHVYAGFEDCQGSKGLSKWLAHMWRTDTTLSTDKAAGDNPLRTKCRICQMSSNFNERHCIKRPRVFVICFLWSSSAAESSNIRDVLACVEPIVDLSEVFASVTSTSNSHTPSCELSPKDSSSIPYEITRQRQRSETTTTTSTTTTALNSCNNRNPILSMESPRETVATTTSKHVFRGFTCYKGRHYIVIFFCWSTQTWTIFNDSVITVAANWEEVINKCSNERWMPRLLFFEDANALAVDCVTRDHVAIFAQKMNEKLT